MIIPNWNGRHLLARCLAAIAEQTWRDFQVIVVDNGSTDGSVEWLKENCPSVEVIVNQDNRGFAAAVNQAVQASSGPYVATLNNDAEPEPGWLEALVQAIECDERVGMCSSKMLFADRPEMINSTGICVDRVGIVWDRRIGELDTNDEQEPVQVFGACGGAALYRRAMLDQVGGFDQDFFAYLEDVDLAWRARLAGWRGLYVPAARVLHRYSATGGEDSPFKNFYLGRNKVWLIIKNYPLPVGLLYLPLVWLYDLGTLPYRKLFRGDWSAVWGRWSALRHWRVAWRKRHLLPDQASHSRWPDGMSPIISLGAIHTRLGRIVQRSAVETRS